MAVTVTHPFVSAVLDGADATVVRPSNWNATHSISGTLDVANGGTGLSAGTSGGVLAFTATGTIASSAALTQYGVVYGGGVGVVPSATANGTTGQVLTATTSGAPSWANPATNGTVTSVSWTGGIVSVATATTTPALTIAGTSGGIPYFSSGTTWATSAALAASALVIGGGAGAAPSTTTTATGALTFLGTPSSANLAALLTDETGTGANVFATSPALVTPTITTIAETDTIAATAATGTLNYDVITQAVQYFTANASGNWTLNFRGSSSVTLNTFMATGTSVSVTLMVTQGSTAYYNSAVTIDGTSVTPKWQGGTAPTSGNASSLDVYTYVIQKTGSATYVVLASQTKFA